MFRKKAETADEAAGQLASDLLALDRSQRLQSEAEQRRWEGRVDAGVADLLALNRQEHEKRRRG